VKEDLLSRFGDVGVVVDDGRIHFVAERVIGDEFLEAPQAFAYVAPGGGDARLDLDEGTMAFTVCQVPVILHRLGDPRIELTYADASIVVVGGLVLDAEASAAIFERSGDVARLDVFLGGAA
jgi:hypothetical protein